MSSTRSSLACGTVAIVHKLMLNMPMVAAVASPVTGIIQRVLRLDSIAVCRA